MRADSSYGIGLSNELSDEQRRLAAVQELFDPATFRHLLSIGIAPGMRCLEVGGGGGSTARFMAEQVGPTGKVVVTDIDVGQLTGCDAPNVEVRVHDISVDPLDESSFDIVHARLVLEHLPTRLGVLDKLAAALRPGGWLLIEDFDFSAWLHLPPYRLFCEPRPLGAVVQACYVASAAVGSTWDGEFGRELPIHLVHARLVDVGGEACSHVIVGGSSASDAFTVSARLFGPIAVAAGCVSQTDLDELIATFERPGALTTFVPMVSAWGHRPA
jgi:SAM-dependent methyltransferase